MSQINHPAAPRSFDVSFDDRPRLAQDALGRLVGVHDQTNA
jgi:hypothetical protein